MGVPVLTLAGDAHATRVGVIRLSALGHEELVATDPDDFVVRAAALARDPDRLADLRAGMRQRMSRSPLCDHRAFASRLEDAYHQLFRDWLASKA